MIQLLAGLDEEVTLVLNFMLFVSNLLKILFVDLFELLLLGFQPHILFNQLIQTGLG